MYSSDIKRANAISNMKVTHINPYNSNKQTFRTTLHNILVIVEDSGYALDFYKQYLIDVYPDIPITVVGAGGYSNIKYALDEFFVAGVSNCILIFDSGTDMSTYSNITRAINKFKKKHQDRNIHIFKPICFEYMLFSFKLLTDQIRLKSHRYIELYTELTGILSGENRRLNMARYSLSFKSLEQLFEEALGDLTAGTAYECIHGKHMSECWVKDCCNVEIRNTECSKLEHKQYNKSTKQDLIASESVLSGLTHIIDSILGLRYRRYINKLNYEYIVQFIGGCDTQC